jgi:adenylate cyclase
MGAEGKKMDYTLIGDNVNLGARVEAMTRDFDAHIIITEFTYNKIMSGLKIGDNSHISGLVFKELGSVKAKGKERSVSIFKVEA